MLQTTMQNEAQECNIPNQIDALPGGCGRGPRGTSGYMSTNKAMAKYSLLPISMQHLTEQQPDVICKNGGTPLFVMRTMESLPNVITIQYM